MLMRLNEAKMYRAKDLFVKNMYKLIALQKMYVLICWSYLIICSMRELVLDDAVCRLKAAAIKFGK